MKRPFSLTILIFGLLLAPSFIHAGDPLRKVAKELSKKIQPLHTPRAAILNFPYHNGKTSSGSTILCERLTTYMAELKAVRVVERNLLKKVLEEQHLSESGVVDGVWAQKIGKVAGVDVIITGTLNDFGNQQTELNIRALKVDTGEVVAASHAVVDRFWTDNPKYPKQIATAEPPEEEKPVPNEAIEIGYPGGRGGGRMGGGMR